VYPWDSRLYAYLSKVKAYHHVEVSENKISVKGAVIVNMAPRSATSTPLSWLWKQLTNQNSSQLFQSHPHQSIAAGTSGDWVKDDIPVNCKTQCRSEDVKGSGPLINGAKSDQFNSNVKGINTDISDVLSSQSVGYVSRVATHKRDLDVRYMRRDLPVCDPIPTPESDSSDPRSLRRTDLSALVEQVVSLCAVQRRL
jgi:hypothetical protein